MRRPTQRRFARHPVNTEQMHCRVLAWHCANTRSGRNDGTPIPAGYQEMVHNWAFGWYGNRLLTGTGTALPSIVMLLGDRDDDIWPSSFEGLFKLILLCIAYKRAFVAHQRDVKLRQASGLSLALLTLQWLAREKRNFGMPRISKSEFTLAVMA